MSENQQFESFAGGVQGSETASETQEQFSERYRQAQAAIRQIKKEESKKKKQDDCLAQIVVQFLGQGDRTAFFLLISRLVAKNIPSDFILAIIALIFKPAEEVIHQKIDQFAPVSTIPEKPNALFRPEEKERIDIWTKNIIHILEAEKERILSTAVEPNGEVNAGVIRLFAMVLREFLEDLDHRNVQMENLESFGETFFIKIISGLKKERGELFLLEEK